MLERLAAAPKQSFLEMRTLKVGALVIVKTRGVAQQWRVSNIKIATGTLVTNKLENSKMTVDDSWFVFDANSDCWFLHRLRFFGDMALQRTTNSFQDWQDILNPGKMMNGEALMVLLEWTIYGFSGENKQGLQSKTWLADRSFWQSWVQENEPHQRLLAENVKYLFSFFLGLSATFPSVQVSILAQMMTHKVMTMTTTRRASSKLSLAARWVKVRTWPATRME